MKPVAADALLWAHFVLHQNADGHFAIHPIQIKYNALIDHSVGKTMRFGHAVAKFDTKVIRATVRANTHWHAT